MPASFLDPLNQKNLKYEKTAFSLVKFSRQNYHRNLFQQLNIEFCPTLETAVIKRQAEYLAGRFCARIALERLSVRNYFLATGGKREPLWPINFVGSITHSDHFAAAIVASKAYYNGLGLDIEEVVNITTMENIKKQVINSDEMHVIELSCASIRIELLFTLVFSAKESFFKAAYPSVLEYFDFDALRLVALNTENQYLTFHITQNLCKSLPKNKEVQVEYDFIAKKSVITYVAL
ncbi:4'-phosphopantetheinyl transferase EntD [Idiomarina loihiensis]|uniref:4'-phosphopantetheinyl transferase family protein n=1 Tax=Idiomarina TaxID=135575 RepID=UPI000D70F342|nr:MULTISPECIES: 4'-phosphopantetheinyl transferase superfamily protein [Idiomarina]PWW40313.1 4'-phosphopantetheinyl transferase EntD [Idiomarina loihiensis]TDP50004.1 4'-phosphopantetheinyl transferase EntD [Idiomarina loihiensis]TDS24644.1 4'-phosphopantetheinyl transferase EntD [Idiomarina sp. H2]